jgi:mitochondrial FAD-linked sulfhydryl oxidase
MNADEAGQEPEHELNRVDTETLGRAGWTLLHSVAAAFPLVPAPAESACAARFIRDFAQLYPCDVCAEGFREIVRADPPDTASGPALARWTCRAHNMVNREIGKPEFDCSDHAIARRWGICDSCKSHAGELDAFKKLSGLSHLR